MGQDLGVPVEYTNFVGMKFRLIPAGEYAMGCRVSEIEAAINRSSHLAMDSVCDVPQ